MSLDFSGVGSGPAGLFLFGGRVTPSASREQPEAVEEVGPISGTEEVTHKIPFNPHTDALQTELRIEQQRRLLGTFMPSESRAGLGALIDLKA